ncbi:Uncharacterised protein [Enterobacter hormaechei]|nr:Uncharacterised protein [Enterobacter hormaechei]CZY91739.1 Uncharacterised protein [Enterobacter hormaechei]
MRYMLLRNIYIRSSYSLHSSPVLLKRSVFFSQPDCYHNLKSSSCYFFLTSSTVHPQPAYQNTDGSPSRNTDSTHQINWDHGHTSYLRFRTHPSTPPGMLIPHTGLNWDHGPTSYLRGRTHPSNPTGNIDSTHRIKLGPRSHLLLAWQNSPVKPHWEYRFHTPDLTGTMVPLCSVVSITIPILRLLQ